MINNTKKPEILAPAGNFEALIAAVNAGADAVYLGGEHFGARAYAGNFDKESLLKAIDHCHLFDINIYLTVNTLFKEDEIERLVEYIEPYYLEGLDAVLVQDMGAARLLHEAYADLPLHSSTQMSISSSYGAELLKKSGFTRIVPAREISLDEAKSIKEITGLEIETFVHGAMCFAYSGKCLLSSFLGGRSGNRGRCAQPCRRLYTTDNRDAYIMSLKDMCVLEDLGKLIAAGIDSFKIEGRMKNPEYVASAVSAYRRIRDSYMEHDDETDRGPEQIRHEAARLKKELMDVYNRGGFSGGYYHIHGGYEMFADERPNHGGLYVGTVKSIGGADIRISLTEDINPGDVLELRTAARNIEITSNKSAFGGTEVELKGRELSMISPGCGVYRTHNKSLLNRIREESIMPERKLHAFARVEAAENIPLKLTLYAPDDHGGKVSITVEGDIIARAKNRATSAEELAEKLKKTTGTNIVFDEVDIRLGENVFVPMSKFNKLRHDAVDALKKVKIEERRR